MRKYKHITILGGGPAGLAAGYYARKKNLPITIYEANNYIGGNAITFRYGNFFFDSGAHRFHDKDPQSTRDLKDLLGDNLKKIDIPSQIYHNGKFIDFPLSPLNLLLNLGVSTFTKSAFEIIKERLVRKPIDCNGDLESYACFKYGRTIATKFLLNYSEKLWGAPCNRLSPNVAGNRIKGLDLATFLKEAILGKKSKTMHLDGSFYYPLYGIGMIPEKLAQACGEENIQKGSRVTKVFHNYSKIRAIEINSEKVIETDKVVNTLPLPLFVRLLEPSCSEDLLNLTKQLSYRNLILVVFFVNKDSITSNGSIYFPDPGHMFTRMYEPKNRSPFMSPKGKTSLAIEIPCNKDSELWHLEDVAIVKLIQSKILNIYGLKNEDIMGSVVKRMSHAYPVLEVGFDAIVREIANFLKRFSNLKVSGRSGMFMYTHLQDMMRFGREIANSYDASGFAASRSETVSKSEEPIVI